MWAAAWGAYHNSLTGPLVLDDTLAIIQNPSVRQLWPLSAVLAPPAECTVAGRPVANLSFALNYAAGGTDVVGYHVVNLWLHASSALVLFGLLHRIFERIGAETCKRSKRIGAGALPLSLGAALIWAVHPLLTAAVSYISQRTELLMAFFYLVTIYGFVRGAASGSPRWLGVSVVACWLGMGSKEGMVTAPIAVLLLDVCFFSFGIRAALRQRTWYYASLAGSWVLLSYLMAGLSHREVGYGLGVTWWRYALTECEALITYLRLIVWPNPLIFDYGPLLAGTPIRTAAFVAGIALWLAGTGYALWRWPRVGFGLLAFSLILAPTSTVVPIATQPIAENRVYLASVPIVTLAVLGWFCLVGRGWVWGGLAAVAGLFVLTVQRNGVYASRERLWTDTAAKRPENPRTYANLGEAAFEAGNVALARERFERALQLKPDFIEARNNLGVAFQRLGNPAAAVQCFNEALRIRPDFLPALNNLGNALLQSGNLPEAQRRYEEALKLASEPHRLAPDLPAMHNGLGNVLLYQGKFDGALDHYRSAARLRSPYPEAEMNAGVALRVLGRLAESREYFQRALAQQPNFPEAHYNFAVAQVQMGEVQNGQRSLEEAVRLKPDFVPAIKALGDLAVQQGRKEVAHAHYGAALALLPNDATLQSLWRMTAPNP